MSSEQSTDNISVIDHPFPSASPPAKQRKVAKNSFVLCHSSVAAMNSVSGKVAKILPSCFVDFDLGSELPFFKFAPIVNLLKLCNGLRCRCRHGRSGVQFSSG